MMFENLSAEQLEGGSGEDDLYLFCARVAGGDALQYNAVLDMTRTDVYRLIIARAKSDG